MAEIDIINIYPPPKDIDISKDIGVIKDNDRPVFEPIDVVLVKDAMVGYYGYISKDFKNIEKIVSPRHRNSVGFKSILSNYFFKKKVVVSTPAISIANGWYDSFYHFTLECLVKLYLLRNYMNEAIVVFPTKCSSFHKQWFDILEIKNIIFIKEDEIIQTPLAISCNFPNRDLNHHDLILPEFRNWILSKVENKVVCSDKIFVGRPEGSKRNLKNQKELMYSLSELGFVYVEMERFSLSDQINIFRNTKEIVAIHGAALAHLAFCNPHTKVIDLIHKDFTHQFCFLKLSKILNIDYRLISCEGDDAEMEQSGYKDIEVDVNGVLSIINRW